MPHESTPLASLLVVDDTVENLRLIASMLSEESYEVRPVTSGRHALQAVEQDPPDLILLDVSMPDMDGYEVCRHLKASEQSRDVPVIFLTAWADRAYVAKAFEVGGVDYITKPFLIEEVLMRVKTHIALRGAQAALARRDERMRELERVRHDLEQRVVHDMRSPLTVLSLNLALLKRHPAKGFDKEGTAALAGAAEAADLLNSMCNDVRDACSRVSRQWGAEPLAARAKQST